MSDIGKLGYEPIPLGPPKGDASVGLLPPVPKPATPVEPRSSLPRVKSEAIIENAPEAKPPMPGRFAWMPEAARALLKPTKPKGVIAAGLASLVAGAWVANLMWPPPKPNVEVAKVEPMPAVQPPINSETIPHEPPKPAAPVTVHIDVPPIVLPDHAVKHAGGTEPAPLPAIALPEIKVPVPAPIPEVKSVLPAAAPTAPPLIELPSMPSPTLPEVKPAPPAVAPTVPEIKIPAATPALPEVKLSPTPEVKPAPPAIALPEVKPVPPPPAIALPEVKPAPPPPVIVIPDSKEPTFVPAGSPKPPSAEPPAMPVVRPVGGMTPREDYDVDVHYVAAGDSWAAISRQHLGDERYADALRSYNANKALVPNQPVDVPPIHVLRKQPGAPTAAPKTDLPQDLPKPAGLKTYEIPASGLTLKDLARLSLGNENLWGRVWEMNPTLRVDAPVPAGTKVKLPSESRIGE